MYEYCTVPELLVLVPYYLEIVLSTVRHACECRYSYSYVHHAGMLHTSTSTVLCCIRVLMPGSFLRFATLCNSTISARCPIKQNSFAKDDKFCQPGGPLDTRTSTTGYEYSRKLFVLGWVGGDMIDPVNILGRSCICPSALSVRSPDFTNFSPFVRVFVCLSVTRIGSILYLSVCVICTFA